jgi:hypothetical protein
MATLTEEEIAMFRLLPEADLVDLAVELDIAVGAEIRVAELVGQAIGQLAELGRREGLPFSEYDRDDLAALPPEQMTALAGLLGVSPTPDAIVKSGVRAARAYQARPRAQVPLMLPMLLPLLARHLSGAGGPG